MNSEQEEQSFERAIHHLCGEFSDLPEEHVRDVVAQVRSQFDDRPIRDFIPLFVERRARVQLAASDVVVE